MPATSDNHQTLIARGRITANHNQTVVQTSPGTQLQHNQTLIQPEHTRRGRMTANHNQTVVRTAPSGGELQHNQTIVRECGPVVLSIGRAGWRHN